MIFSKKSGVFTEYGILYAGVVSYHTGDKRVVKRDLEIVQKTWPDAVIVHRRVEFGPWKDGNKNLEK